jgi:EAL domain-containing protein (putative c-di-GMP-specific phosphodiesterase class I)
VAEGIETESQLTELKRLGCPYGQGYLLSRPMDQAQVVRFMLAQTERAAKISSD